ncbi:MAG: hypothetical protein R3Y63_05485 [Eubacteriales bacterium]
MNLYCQSANLAGFSASHLSYDGKYYYFPLFSQNKILKTTEDFQIIEEFPTLRPYDCLCFDREDCCFWATVSGCASRIYQLDCLFQEIACLCLSLPFSGKITALSFQCCDNSLLIAFPSGALFYHKESQKITPLPLVKGIITSALSLCPGYFLVARQGKDQILYTFYDTGEEISRSVIPKGISVQDLSYNPCYSDTAKLDFLFRESGCYSKISSIPITSYELGYEPCICNHKICQHCCKAPPCPSTEGALSDLIESIALIEAALAHILNAQGEELQKVVAEDSTIEEMLDVNGKINQTIGKVTGLEKILLEKLSKATELSQIPPELKGNCCHKAAETLIECDRP